MHYTNLITPTLHSIKRILAWNALVHKLAFPPSLVCLNTYLQNQNNTSTIK